MSNADEPEAPDLGLAGVRNATARLREAERDLIDEVRAALEAGEQVTYVADVVGVTRQTIYRWRDHDPRVPKARVSIGTRRALDEAITAMLGVGVGQAAATDLASALAHRDLAVKARRIQRGIRSLTTPMRDVSEDSRRAIAHGQLAAAAVDDAIAKGREIPDKIRVDS